MRQNPRQPSQLACDNPAGRTRNRIIASQAQNSNVLDMSTKPQAQRTGLSTGAGPPAPVSAPAPPQARGWTDALNDDGTLNLGIFNSELGVIRSESVKRKEFSTRRRKGGRKNECCGRYNARRQPAESPRSGHREQNRTQGDMNLNLDSIEKQT